MLIYPTILKLGRNDSGPKRPRAETIHKTRPKRPTPKIGRNDPGRNDPGPKRPGTYLTPVFFEPAERGA